MILRILPCLALLGLIAATPVPGVELVLDAFDYADEAAAREVWRPDERSPEVLIEAHRDGSALKMFANFSENDRRVVYDRVGKWDLSRWNRFTLDIAAPNPSAFAHFTVYFRSTGGWYRGGFSVSQSGWQTVNLSRTTFQVEGSPAGWHDITGIRLDAWVGAPFDTYYMADNLIAYQDDIVILTDPSALTGQGEGRAAQQAATLISGMLQEYGVYVGAIAEAELLAGDLPDNPLIILPYNPSMTEGAVQRLVEYIGRGGKIIGFYTLKRTLLEALGMRQTGWERRAYYGQFTTIKLAADAVHGLPRQVGQNSWNISICEPQAAHAKIIGQWYDAEDKDTGYPALLLSDTGAFMSHILLPDDPVTKRRLLMALVGHFVPEAWATAGKAAAQLPALIGHLSGDSALQRLRDFYAADTVPHELQRAFEEGRKALAEANDLIKQTTAAEQSGDHLKAIQLADERDRQLRDAYALMHRSRQGEFRAVWEHSGTGAYEDWDETMRVLAEAGFNAIMPNSFWGGSALYESKLLPVSPIVAEKGDQIAAAVAAGKKYGIQIHPWKVNFRLARDCPQDFIDRMRAEGRLQVSRSGEQGNWLCPSHPANRELEIASMVEVATKYDVAGVHFDYIRYPGSANCYCDGCRKRFQQDTGIKITNWPDDLRDPQVEDKWLAWRAEQITIIVRETTRRVHEARPECKVSAAVFSSYPGCYLSIGQDWVRWAKKGYVDFLCPMDYSNSDFSFAAKVIRQLNQVGGAVPVYPGIGASSSNSALTADRVAGQIAIARNLGSDGFIIFNYTSRLGNDILPVLAKGVTSTQVTVPHHAPRFDFGLPEPTPGPLWAIGVKPGEQISGSITRLPDRPGLDFDGFLATLNIERPDGTFLTWLGEFTDEKPLGDFSFVIEEPGLYRIAIWGYGNGKSPSLGTGSFTVRSIPIIVGDIAPDFAVFVPGG